MFWDPSDQYLDADIMACLSDGYIKRDELRCFVCSLELKLDVLPTNSCVTHELNLHDDLKSPIYSIYWSCFDIQKPLTVL